MTGTVFQEIRDSLRGLYLDGPRPWLVGFSGGNWVVRATRLRVSAIRSHNRSRELQEQIAAEKGIRADSPPQSRGFR
jgi:hypothetical protein